MVNWTDLELRFGDHAVRVARADRDGWRRPAPRPVAGGRRRIEGVIGRVWAMRVRGDRFDRRSVVAAGDTTR